MKQFLHKIMSIVMAVVVLVSTMSFTINMHYCGDTLVETTVIRKAKGCGMDMQKPSTENCSKAKESCCENEQLAIEGQDELQLQLDKISLEQYIFISSLVYSYINGFEGIDKNISSYEEYRPPLVIRRIYQLDETYLI
ncbi:hypothetical protein ACFO5O_05255 [Geojedonia litorea]|uniref:Secreted protein n=1 Tax=Geojedonia litorea TaxID=1268269 RepID=A0ABV9N348_9FLAO